MVRRRGVVRVEWGKCTPTLQADSICNWLESASLEGILGREVTRRSEKEIRTVRQREGRVTGGRGRLHTRSRHIGQCRDTPGALFSTSHLLTYLPPPFAYPDQRTYHPDFPAASTLHSPFGPVTDELGLTQRNASAFV